MFSDLVNTLFETRSFDNVWYWLFVAVSWSLTTYWTLGVGHNDALHAKREGGKLMAEFETVVQIYCERLTEGLESYGTFAVLVIGFFLGSIMALGFWTGIFFMQALFLLLFPLFLASLLSAHVAKKQVNHPLSGNELMKRYLRLRRGKQALGAVSITVASLWAAIVTFRVPTF